MEENIKYHHQLPIQLRFNDVDRYGHVNNNAYFSFYDLGKVDYFNLVLKIYNGKPDVVPVIANINADFIAPVLYGDDIVMETCVSHVGRKSFTLEHQPKEQQRGLPLPFSYGVFLIKRPNLGRSPRLFPPCH